MHITQKKLIKIFAGVLLSSGTVVMATSLPPETGDFFLQTNGTGSAIGRGDWYSSPDNGVGAGAHVFEIFVPEGWPIGKPIDIDLQSPEFNSNSPVGTEPTDENFNNHNSMSPTRFELFTGITRPDPEDPTTLTAGSGISGSQTSYPRSSDSIRYRRWYTIANPNPGTSYFVRVDAGNADGDNGWRLRVGDDNDSDPNNALPANYSDADGVPGTDDELVIGFVGATFQQNTGSTKCQTFYGFVPNDHPSVTFDNFDMDNNGRIRYYGPSATFDPNAQTGGVAGTVSSNSRWNGGTQTTRSGDTINNPEPGYWRIPTCISHNNQYSIESDVAVVFFMEKPRVPEIELTKTAEYTLIGPDTTFDYTIEFENNASGDSAGAAKTVQIIDTLPPEVEYRNAVLSAPYTGTISHSNGIVTVDIDQRLDAGDSGTLTITVEAKKVLNVASFTNEACMTFIDSLGFENPPICDTALIDVNPLLVELVGFTAHHSGPGGGVDIDWETAAELGSVSFDVYAVTNKTSWPGQKLNEFPIPAMGSPMGGATYSFNDERPLAEGETRTYYLMETEFDGTENYYGPASVSLGGRSSGLPRWVWD